MSFHLNLMAFIATGSKTRTWHPACRRRSMVLMAGDWRMSSVSGLNESPHSATVLPAMSPAKKSLKKPAFLLSIDLVHSLQDLHGVAVLLPNVDEVVDILWE